MASSTIKKNVGNDWTQLTTAADWLVQVGEYPHPIKVAYSDAEPSVDAPGMLLYRDAVLSSGVLPGTLWGKTLDDNPTYVIVSE